MSDLTLEDVKAEGPQPEGKVELQVEVSWERLDLDDLLLIEDFQAKRNINPIQLAGLLDRVIVGGIRGKHYPRDMIAPLFAAVSEAFDREANPVDASGKV